MSEPTLPLSADLAEEDAQPAGRRRTLLAVGGLGVVALAAVGVLALTGPADDDLELGLPAGSPAAAATPSPSAGPAETPVVTAEVQRGRDPFRAPAGAAGAGSAGGGAGAAPGTAAPVAPPEGGAVPVEAPAAVPEQPSGPVAVDEPAPGGAEVGAVRTVTLVRVAGEQTAVLSVDGAAHTVRVGEAFGPGGALLLLSLQSGPDDGQWTAVVQQGSGEPFDVVTGAPAAVA